jgi:outer membrane protein
MMRILSNQLQNHLNVIPAEAGIQSFRDILGPRLRGGGSYFQVLQLPLSIIILLLLSTHLLAEEPTVKIISLDEALQTATANQPQLRQAQATTAAARARADEAFAPLLPQASGTAAYQRLTANFAPRPGSLPSNFSQTQTGSQSTTKTNAFDTFNYFNFGVSVNQLIYDFNQTKGKYDAAKMSVTAQEKTERATLLQVMLNVRSAYFGARANKSLVAVARETLENQERHLAQIQGFVEVGTRPEIDLAQARTDRANAQVQLINAENNYETAKAQLNQAMGVETTTDYEVTDETFSAMDGEDRNLEDLLGEATKARPEFASLENQIRAQELTLSSIKGGYWPSLSVSTGLTEAGTYIDNLKWNWNAALTLTWPFYQGGFTQAQVSEAHENILSLKAQLDALRIQIRLEVNQARLAVRAAKAAIGAADEAIVNARERLNLAEGRYQTGVGNSIELGDSQLALNNTLAQKIQAEYNLATARAQLIKALGRF